MTLKLEEMPTDPKAKLKVLLRIAAENAGKMATALEMALPLATEIENTDTARWIGFSTNIQQTGERSHAVETTLRMFAGWLDK